jgi:hypothetical protein
LRIVLTGDAVVSFVSAGIVGVFFAVEIIQDSVGGHLLTWPSNMKNMGAVDTDPNSVSTQFCSIDTDGSARGLGPMMYS